MAISGKVSLVAIPANVLVEPAVPPATVIGVLAAVVAPMWGTGADGLAWLASWPASWIALVGHQGARVPGAVVGWSQSGVGALLLAGTCWGGTYLLRTRRARLVGLAVAIGVAFVAIPVQLSATVAGGTGAGRALLGGEVVVVEVVTALVLLRICRRAPP